MWKLKKYRGKYAAVTRIQGKPVRRSSGSADFALAQQWFEDFKRIQAGPRETVKAVFDAYKEERSENEKKKLGFMWKSLEKHFSNFRPDQIDREKARKYAEFRRKQGISDNTIIRELGSLRAALRWYNKAYPPTFYMPSKPDGKDRYLTREEYSRLLEAATAPHIKLFIILALSTAGRTTAILELKWSQVNFKNKMIDLGRGNRIKRRATVPLNDMAMEELELGFKYRQTDYVIEYADRPVASIRTGFDAACVRAKLKDVTPHVLRHTAAVWMAEAGCSMSEIAQFLGHSSSQVTERTYARYSPDYLRKGANVLQVNRGSTPRE